MARWVLLQVSSLCCAISRQSVAQVRLLGLCGIRKKCQEVICRFQAVWKHHLIITGKTKVLTIMVDGHPTIFDFSQFLSTNFATLLQNIAGRNFEKPCTQFPRRVVPGHLRSFQVRGAFCPVSFVQSLCAVIMSKRELLLKNSFQFVALQVNQKQFVSF